MTTHTDLVERGFDHNERAKGVYPRYQRPRCSQCSALVVQGTAVHESGCPNEPGECKWCGSTTHQRASFCDDSSDRSYNGLDSLDVQDLYDCAGAA